MTSPPTHEFPQSVDKTGLEPRGWRPGPRLSSDAALAAAGCHVTRDAPDPGIHLERLRRNCFRYNATWKGGG